MAIKTFRVGKVLIEATQIANVDNATLNITFAAGDVTAIGMDWRDIVALGRAGTLTLTCSYDPADTAQALIRTEFISGDGYLSAIQMWEDTSHYFAMSGAFVSTCTITKATGGVDKFNATVEARGAIAYT
jgi:hypothetical protein